MRPTAPSVGNARRGVKAADLALIAGVLGVAAALSLARPDDAEPRGVLVGSVDGEQALSIDTARRLQVPGPIGVSVVVVDSGRVRVESSPCRQQVCVRRGWLRDVGEVAACVPNGVVVRVAGRGRAALDGVSR